MRNNTHNSTTKIDCVIFLLSTDTTSILLNILRMSVLILYLGWFIIIISFKDFRNKNMAFLYNLNIVSLIKAIYGFYLSLINNCYEPDNVFCYISTFFNLFNGAIPGKRKSAFKRT